MIRVFSQKRVYLDTCIVQGFFFFFFSHTFSFQLLDKPWSQVSSLHPPPRFLPSIFIARRVQQSHWCSSIFHRVLQTHALALSASQFVRKKKSPRIFTSMHSGGFELQKLTYTRLEDNLIRHRGDLYFVIAVKPPNITLQGQPSSWNTARPILS